MRRDKAERLSQQADQSERQQQELAHLQRFVDRFRYGTKSRQAQSKLKAMARIERIDRPDASRVLRSASPSPSAAAAWCSRSTGWTSRSPAHAGARTPTSRIERGQRVALIGRNGAGKTSLLETLLGRRAPARGRVKLGHNVTLGYYSQHALDLPRGPHGRGATVQGTGLTQPQARDLLGGFLFSGDAGREAGRACSRAASGDAWRWRALVASGAQLPGARRAHQPPRHREPRGARGRARRYDGTVLLVSHDRALIDALATRTLAIEDGRLRLREGAFGEYARDHEQPPTPKPAPAEARPPERKPAKTPAPGSARPSQRVQRETPGSSARSSGWRRRWAGWRRGCRSPTPTTIHDALAEDGLRHRQLQEELSHLYRRWELTAG